MSRSSGRHGVDSTPGTLGYFIAVFVSWVLIAGGLGLVSSLPSGSDDRLGLLDTGALLLTMTFLWACVAGFFAFFTALPGLLLVHAVALRFPQQWVQIVASAVVGVLGVYAVAIFVGEQPRDWDRLALGVGICTAVGRASVIPIVPAVKEAFSPPTPWWRRFSLR
jgi:hypothetical protein